MERPLNFSATEFGWEDQGSRFVPRQGYERICPKEISGEIKCSCKKGCSNVHALKTTSNARSLVNVELNARIMMKKMIHVLIWQVFHQNQSQIVIKIKKLVHN